MVSNPNQYSKSATSPTAQIEDGVDFPHTGIIKALSDGLGQNYAISGFDITIDSATQIDVGAGVIFRDGNKVSISAVNNMALSSTYTNGYHLLVADSSNVLRIRNPTAVNKVPEYTAGDTIIAVVTHNGTANVGLQYLTVNKTENSLSIGYNNSGYTEMSKITAASGGTTVEVPTAGGDFVIDNTDADKKIVARLGSDDANTAFEVRNNSDAAKLSVTGAGVTTVTGSLSTTTTATIGTDLTVSGGDINYGNGQDSTLKVAATTSTTAGRDLTIEAGSTSTGSNNINGGDLILKSGGGDGTGTSIMTFSTKVSGTDTVGERMRIHTDGKVGIGTNSPDNLLEIQNSDSTTNSVVHPLKITEETSGTPAVGLGVGMQFEVETSAGNNEIGATIDAVITNTSSTSEQFKLVFNTMTQGNAASEILSLSHNNISNPAAGRIIEPGFVYNYGGSIYVSGPTSSKGNISFLRVAILDVQDSPDNFFALPATSGVSNGQLITLKNPTTASAIISPQTGDEIDFGSTNNGMIGSANVLTLPSAGCVTLMCYKSWDKGNLTESPNNGLGVSQNGWFVVNQTV